MARRVYHVTPKGLDWIVQSGGVELFRSTTKQPAVDWAVQTAKANKPSQVVVHRSDGTIETEWTYGDDPFPPAG